MASITLRQTKGTPLTNAEIDANFTNLNNAKLETNGSGANLTSLNASNISSGTLAVARGGTGQTTYTNGQLLIGNTTGNTLTKATLTQGTNIVITNGAGSISIETAANPSFTTITTSDNITVGGDVAVKGGDITTTATGVFNLVNANATIVNIAAGASSGLNLGNASGTTTIRSSIVIGTQSVQNLWNSVATTINFGGQATAIGIGSSTGTTTINHNLTVNGTITGTLSGSATTLSSTLPINLGGTNATTAVNARTNLGLGTTSSVQFGSFGVGTAASGTTGEIRATNNITAFFSSDKKFKENVQDIDSALSKVEAIGGKTFDWTDEYINDHGGEDGYFVTKEDFGVIAQDVQAVFPLAVKERIDGTLAVDYPKLCALAFAAIKELSEKVRQLESK